MTTTWILIANASAARLFQTETKSKTLKLIQKFEHPQSRQKVVDLVTGDHGRYRAPHATPGGMYQEPTDPKKVEMERFAHELALKLNEGRTKNLYHNLILVAPSHFHGLLNKHCNQHVKNLIVDTLYKDYTKIRQHDLATYLNGKLTLNYAA